MKTIIILTAMGFLVVGSRGQTPAPAASPPALQARASYMGKIPAAWYADEKKRARHDEQMAKAGVWVELRSRADVQQEYRVELYQVGGGKIIHNVTCATLVLKPREVARKLIVYHGVSGTPDGWALRVVDPRWKEVVAVSANLKPYEKLINDLPVQ